MHALDLSLRNMIDSNHRLMQVLSHLTFTTFGLVPSHDRFPVPYCTIAHTSTLVDVQPSNPASPQAQPDHKGSRAILSFSRLYMCPHRLTYRGRESRSQNNGWLVCIRTSFTFLEKFRQWFHIFLSWNEPVVNFLSFNHFLKLLTELQKRKREKSPWSDMWQHQGTPCLLRMSTQGAPDADVSSGSCWCHHWPISWFVGPTCQHVGPSG